MAKEKYVKLSDVIKAVDENSVDIPSGIALKDDITCILEDVPTVDLGDIEQEWYHKGIEYGNNHTATNTSKFDRKTQLLAAAYKLLYKQSESPIVLNLLEEIVYYDNAECDGACLMDDINILFFEEGIDVDEVVLFGSDDDFEYYVDFTNVTERDRKKAHKSLA